MLLANEDKESEGLELSSGSLPEVKYRSEQRRRGLPALS